MLILKLCSVHTLRCAGYSALLFCGVLAALSLPTSARAQFRGSASATAQFESNSNVFDLNSGLSPSTTDGGKRSDTYYAYGAEFDAKYLWGRQEFYGTASTTQYEYQHFTELDHNAYDLDGGLNWKLGGAWDGKVDVIRTHTMVPFYNLTGSALALSLMTEQRESAEIALKLSSKWKLDATGFTSKSEQPVPSAPDLRLIQSSGTFAVDYIGITNLTGGLTAGYLTGNYSGSNVTLNPSYTQENVGVLASYKHYRATFDGQLGYSRRVSSSGTDNTSGLTGLLDLVHQLTPKTSYTVKLDRTINSYFLTAGSEIDTEAAASVDWQATYKLRVTGGYSFTYRDFPGQGNNPVGSNRVDIQESANLSLTYKPQRWLEIRPYANILTRRSTFIGGHYSANIYGVYLTVTPYHPK